jgi:ketosteroid isomerase-like protein
MSTPHETVKAYFAGVNEERYADVGALFTEDGMLFAPGVPTLRGPAVAGYFEVALAAYPQHYDDPVRTLVSGLTATVEIHFTGVTDGGVPLEFDAVDIFDFDADGGIVKMSSWYDSYLVRKKLWAARSAVEGGS